VRARARGPAPSRRGRERPRTYTAELLPVLRKVWATLDRCCGKRLAAVMEATIAALERHDEISLTPEHRELLCSASPATLDRLLAPERRRLRLKGRSMTKPGTLLKSQIPVRTFAERDHAKADFLEIDLVSHGGGDPRGEFAYSLCATDVASGWTEPRVVCRSRPQVDPRGARGRARPPALPAARPRLETTAASSSTTTSPPGVRGRRSASRAAGR